MPLGPAVETLARERAGAFSRRAGRLAKLLNLGVPLPDALEFCPGLLSANALPIVRVGSQSGALAPALRQAAKAKTWHDVVWASLMAKIAYVLMLPVFGVIVLTFVMVWIIPKFAKIFHDFGTELPQMTRWLIGASRFYFEFWYLLLPLYLAIGVLLLMAVMRYFGWIEADLPGMGRIVRRLDAARILESLAIVTDQKKPLAEGLATLAGTYPKPKVRNSLSFALHDMACGGDWAESLCRHGLFRRTDVALLQAAQRVGNLAWAMREIGDSNRRRFIYRLQAIVQAAFPPVVILLGLIVMFIVVSLFLPLVALIEKLA
jgi:type II secretory pathway component PulF